MPSNECLNECGQHHNIAVISSVLSSSQASVSPESQITLAPSLPAQPDTSQSNKQIPAGNTEHGKRPLIEAVFDGACEPTNPGGHASYGALVRVNGQVVYSNSGYVGYGSGMSNNVAEYCGAIDALTEAVKHKGTITLIGDSRLVMMQLGPDLTCGKRRWKAKSGLYLPYYKKAIALVNQHRGRIRFQWVPREDNTDCDELSKKALLERGVKVCIRPKGKIAIGRKGKKAKPAKSARRWRKRKGATDFNKNGGKC